MLVTEEEARERWCPFDQGYLVPGSGSDVGEMTCIASRCMAWQWMPLMADQPFMDAVKSRMDTSSDSHAKAVKYVRANLPEYELPDKPFRGYCGLAGKP